MGRTIGGDALWSPKVGIAPSLCLLDRAFFCLPVLADLRGVSLAILDRLSDRLNGQVVTLGHLFGGHCVLAHRQAVQRPRADAAILDRQLLEARLRVALEPLPLFAVCCTHDAILPCVPMPL